MDWSLTEERDDNNELKAVHFCVYDSSCISEPVNYSSHRYTFKLHYAKDGKRILCTREDK